MTAYEYVRNSSAERSTVHDGIGIWEKFICRVVNCAGIRVCEKFFCRAINFACIREHVYEKFFSSAINCAGIRVRENAFNLTINYNLRVRESYSA
jgi:hypothetical protein